ncbi:hypothetical protein [Aliivibrio fischeri]|uniref:hypothetical protein n=1 Tax=Aliivibrio fischeri TaxID=668 RepID=UPI00080DDF24|nr:hypothetical protein [Aliivibrio fischeri]OCH43707.1 hypothetical protein A6E02_11470 [Aliivibrio fischeri]
MDKNIDLNIIYKELISWTTPRTYEELSLGYEVRTGLWCNPQRWHSYLKKLGTSLYFASPLSPPLCALVVSNASKRPRDTFWGSAPHIPSRHDKLEIRILQWQEMVNKVLNHSWPEQMPIKE